MPYWKAFLLTLGVYMIGCIIIWVSYGEFFSKIYFTCLIAYICGHAGSYIGKGVK